MKKLYLAGPDVFRENAAHYFKVMKEMCTDYGFIGLSPFDSEAPMGSTSANIFYSNVKLIDKCDIVVANIDPFRGPNVDDGTAFEIGYAYAANKPVWGYTSVCGIELKEVSDIWEIEDVNYPHVEDFGLSRNLMICHSIDKHGKILDTFSDVLQALKRAEEPAQV